MDNLTARALETMIHKQFELWNEQKDSMEQITEVLLHGCTDKDSAEKVYSRMIINSMEIAANISAKLIFEILLTGGVIKPVDENRLRKNVIRIVKK